jgi:hypothetical protein
MSYTLEGDIVVGSMVILSEYMMDLKLISTQ